MAAAPVWEGVCCVVGDVVNLVQVGLWCQVDQASIWGGQCLGLGKTWQNLEGLAWLDLGLQGFELRVGLPVQLLPAQANSSILRSLACISAPGIYAWHGIAWHGNYTTLRASCMWTGLKNLHACPDRSVVMSSEACMALSALTR